MTNDLILKSKEYQIIGLGNMIDHPCQIGDWWVVPAQDYQGKIPVKVQQNLFEFINQGNRIDGIMVVEDMRVIQAREEREAKKREMINQGVKKGFKTLAVVTSTLVVGALYIASALVSLDPMLIVCSEGRLICLGIWFD